MKAHCDNCQEETEHTHLHDEAHGLAGTHMDGTERFVCKKCGKATHSGEPGHDKFIFILDKR